MKKLFKKLTVVMLAVFMFVGSISYTNNAQAAEKEMRAAWVSRKRNESSLGFVSLQFRLA